MLEKWSDSQEKGREGRKRKSESRDRDIVPHKGTEHAQRKTGRRRKKREGERAEGNIRSLEREGSLCERSEGAIARSKVKKQAAEKRAEEEGERRGDGEVRDKIDR